MRVLVAYGSKRGGTEGIARMIGSALTDAGIDAEVRPARDVRSVAVCDAVVVGGALYAFRWHRDARRFVKRHHSELRRLPVWLFSSGPLDDSARTREIPPVKQVDRLIGLIGARGHATFGGRLGADAKGFPASAMAKKNAGDWRDEARIREWARGIADELRRAAAA